LQDEAGRAATLIEGLDSMTCYFGIDASHSALFQTLLRDLRPVVVSLTIMQQRTYSGMQKRQPPTAVRHSCGNTGSLAPATVAARSLSMRGNVSAGEPEPRSITLLSRIPAAKRPSGLHFPTGGEPEPPSD
jgi:hypothetical protein